MTDNKKYVKRGQALIIRDDPQRYEERAGANRNKVGAYNKMTDMGQKRCSARHVNPCMF